MTDREPLHVHNDLRPVRIECSSYKVCVQVFLKRMLVIVMIHLLSCSFIYQ